MRRTQRDRSTAWIPFYFWLGRFTNLKVSTVLLRRRPHLRNQKLIVHHSNFGLRRPLRVNGTHYRAAVSLSASPQLAESIRAAKRFRVVPGPDVSRCSK